MLAMLAKSQRETESFIVEHVERLQTPPQNHQPVKMKIVQRNREQIVLQEIPAQSDRRRLVDINSSSVVFLSDHP